MTAGPLVLSCWDLGLVATGRSLNYRRNSFAEKRSTGLGVQRLGVEWWLCLWLVV